MNGCLYHRSTHIAQPPGTSHDQTLKHLISKRQKTPIKAATAEMTYTKTLPQVCADSKSATMPVGFKASK